MNIADTLENRLDLVDNPGKVRIRFMGKDHAATHVACPNNRFALVFFDNGRQFEMNWESLLAVVWGGRKVIY